MQKDAPYKPGLFQITLLYFPLAFVLAGGILAFQFPTLASGMLFALAWLYLLPPLTCRSTQAMFGTPLTNDSTVEDKPFRLWWFLTQLQMIFNRIGLLEDLLRLVPGLYGSWLTLWGSRVSPFSFWGRDILISERYLLTVGPGAVIASQTGFSGHLLTLDEQGVQHLLVAPIVVDTGVMLGIRSGLGPGCRVAAKEMLPAGRMLPPFTLWRDGRKQKLPR
jgi:hypothetical protein